VDGLEGGRGEPAWGAVPLAASPPRPDLVPAGIDIRGLALAIDAMVWLAIAVPLAMRSGGVRWGPGTWRLGIFGWPLVLSLLLWLAYMAVSEGFAGTSLGKRVTGLRVIGPDGGIPGLGRSLVRNLLRFVDALPYVPPYVLGGVAAMRSHARLRVGDRVAGTRVVRGPVRLSAGPLSETRDPSERRLIAGLVLVVCATAVGALTLEPACSVGDGKFECYGVAFRYPADWKRIGDHGIPPTPTQLWVEGVGVDARSLVTVQAYRRLRSTLSVRMLEEGQRDLAREWADVLHGSFEGPEALDVGGHPAFQIEVRGTLEESPFTVVSVTVYDASTEYAVVCQWKEALAERLSSGCEQVLSTLAVP
jgi:uncharacterized RDD family membrane protein YckC